MCLRVYLACICDAQHSSAWVHWETFQENLKFEHIVVLLLVLLTLAKEEEEEEEEEEKQPQFWTFLDFRIVLPLGACKMSAVTH